MARCLSHLGLLSVLALCFLSAPLASVTEIKVHKDTPSQARTQERQVEEQIVPSPGRVDLDRLMSSPIKSRTGVSRLTPEERDALESWLYEWREEVRADAATSTFFYRVSRNWNSGAEIHLDNGAIWKIAPSYRRVARNWLPGQRIEVSTAERTGNAYPSQLYNQSSGETVEARLVRAAP